MSNSDTLASLVLDALRAEREAARASARFIYDHHTPEADLRSTKEAADADARAIVGAMWAAFYDLAGGEADAEDEDAECDGHESLDGAHMGETVFCDGTCV